MTDTDLARVLSFSPSPWTGRTEAGEPAAFTVEGTNFGNDMSALTLTIDHAPCPISTLTTGTDDDGNPIDILQGLCGGLPVGSARQVRLHTQGVGYAFSGVKIRSQQIVRGLTPSVGSVEGGTLLTISGNGFHIEGTVVLVGGESCPIESINLDEVVCTAPAHSAGEVAVTVRSNSNNFNPELAFTFTDDQTPTVTAITPTTGAAGDTITLTGNTIRKIP